MESAKKLDLPLYFKFLKNKVIKKKKKNSGLGVLLCHNLHVPGYTHIHQKYELLI